MRTFNTVTRRTGAKPSLKLSILASDASSTYVYNDVDLLDVPSLRYRGSFGGGMAEPVAYNISLGFKAIGEVKDIKDKLLQGTATLQVTINSDQFTPHVGRVKTTKRPGTDPLRLELGIVDKFFDDDPTIPNKMMADSYSPIHPSDAGQGQPLYYGDFSKRFAYHTAINSDVTELLKPINIPNSIYDVSSVFVMLDPSEGTILAGAQDITVNSLTITSSTVPFAVINKEVVL